MTATLKSRPLKKKNSFSLNTNYSKTTCTLDETNVVLLSNLKSTTNFVPCVQTSTLEIEAAPGVDSLKNESVKLNSRQRRRRKIKTFKEKFQQLDSKDNVISGGYQESSQNVSINDNSNDIQNPTGSKPKSAKHCDAFIHQHSLQESSSESDCKPIPEHQRRQFNEIQMVDSTSYKSRKTSILNGGFSHERPASKKCNVSRSCEHPEIYPNEEQRRKLETSNFRESETQTEESSSIIIGRSKVTKRTSSTQTCFKTSNRFTQTAATPPTESSDTVNTSSVKSVPNTEHSKEAFITQVVQLEPKKVKKRVKFAERVDEKIIKWTHVSNEPLWQTPLAWSISQFCEEPDIKENMNLNVENLHCNNATSKLDNPLIDACPNPELCLMGALGLSRNLSKTRILSKSNQNLCFEEFNNQNVTHEANQNTSTGKMCQSKPVKGILKSSLTENEQLEHNIYQPHVTLLTTGKNILADRTDKSFTNALAANNFSGLILPTNKENTQPVKKTNVKRRDYAKELQAGIFKISIFDVLPRYRSVSNEIIRSSVEMAQIIGVKSALHMANGCNKPLQPAEEVIIFYSGCNNDLHYVTVDIWNRTVKLYSQDNITLSIVEHIGKEKLDVRKIVAIWNLGIQKVWYYTSVDINYKLKVVEENRGTQYFQGHQYIFTNMTTEGLPLCKYSINYFMKKAKLLMEEHKTAF